jgi:hypothetical protein
MIRFLVASPSKPSWETGLLYQKGSGSVGEPKVRIHLSPAERVYEPSVPQLARRQRARSPATIATVLAGQCGRVRREVAQDRGEEGASRAPGIGAGQLDRRRYGRDPAQHHQRTRAENAARADRRHRKAVQGCSTEYCGVVGCDVGRPPEYTGIAAARQLPTFHRLSRICSTMCLGPWRRLH